MRGDAAKPNRIGRAVAGLSEHGDAWRAFEGCGSVLLLRWHHLQELLSHENKTVIEQRFNYIA